MSVPVYLYCLLVSTVSLSEADYNFTISFFEFRNPLGLQCGECGNGGPPACCDDVHRLENCNMTRPFTCDTRFRFMLRTFGEPVETAPNTGFPYFTPSNVGNSQIFTEGPSAFIHLSNPFTITRTKEWSGRIQFFIDAIDRATPLSTSLINETLAIINRFPIDLELNPGPNFTERTTYTGIYGISDVGFDMSFRVQCLENYFGPNCTFCEPLEGVYTCDSEGRPVCLESANFDPTTNCTTCLPNYDQELNCTRCLLGRTLSSNCTTCLPGFDPSSNCTQCVTGRDITTNCTNCLPGFDILTNCTTCVFGCKIASVDVQTCPSQTSIETESAPSSASTPSVVVSAAVGGVLAVSVIMNIVLVIIVVVMYIRGKGKGVHSSQSYEVKEQEANEDIEMKPNTVYGVTSEPHDPPAELMACETTAEYQYECVNP